jgi:Ca-activated chloride channel family protein
MPLELHWLRPAWLALLPVLTLALVLLLRRARRARQWESLVDERLRPHVLTAAGGGRAGPLLAGLAVLWLLVVLALAGPAWQLAQRPVFRIEQPRVLLLDLSGSMQAKDIAPSRLARGRFEVMDLLRNAKEGQFALIAFGAEPFLIAPLTTDARTIREQVPLLTPAVLPVTGERRTDLALGLAGQLLRRSAAAAADIILITDAVGPAEPAAAAAAALADGGHRVSVLALAPDPGLDALARAGGGIVVPSRADDVDTARLLALQGDPDPRVAGAQVSLDQQWRDDGPWLLLLALPLAALAFRRGWLAVLPLALVLLPPVPAQAGIWDDLWLRPEQQALRDAAAGRLDAALARVDDPRWRAAVRYRAGDYSGALEALAGQRGADAHYNRGNVLARLGRFEAALAEYDAALALVPTHADARHNRRLLRELAQRQGPARAAAGRETQDAGGRNDGEAGTETAADAAGEPAGPGRADASSAAARGGEAAGAEEPAAAGGDGPAQPAAGTDAPVADTGGAADAARSSDDARSAGHPGGPPAATAAQPGVGRPGAGQAAAQAGRDAPQVATWSGTDGAATDTQLDAADAYLLQQVPDDPARLLRERLMLQYLRRHGQLY